eukprot:6865402-Prymnesium_polylepis.2
MSDRGEWVVVAATTKEAPLEHAVRQLSLDKILECDGCPYEDAAALLHEFGRGSLAKGAGTRLVMWRLDKDLDLTKAGDIRVPARADAPLHERSLRAYSEVLYLKVGTDIEPNMRIIIKGKEVVPRDWAEAAYLHELRSEFALPQPSSKEVLAQFDKGERGAKNVAADATAKITLGYPITIRELERITSMRTYEEGGVELKASLKEHTGLFFYHKRRMTRALETLKVNRAAAGVQHTSMMRITQLGVGLTGFVEENFMVQTHNKASYKDDELFSAVLGHANAKVKEYLRTQVTPVYSEIKGLLPANAPRPVAPAPPAAPPKKAPHREKVSDP